jgi:L,D-transpeptidase ErfK/SrfK
VVPPGPDNPLGEYALYLGWPTYLIHGTNLPYGVGRRVSRGCIRMYPEGVARLYPQVAPGTRVTAVDQRVKVGWHEGELYLEAQPDMDQLDELEATQTMTPRAPALGDRQRVVDRAGPDAARVDWAVVEAELVSRRGIPVQITRPRPVIADRYGAPSAGRAPGEGESPPPPVVVRRGVGGGGLY